jgi:hypothetical protein
MSAGSSHRIPRPLKAGGRAADPLFIVILVIFSFIQIIRRARSGAWGSVLVRPLRSAGGGIIPPPAENRPRNCGFVILDCGLPDNLKSKI